jgi:trans-aconitate methyltransferase
MNSKQQTLDTYNTSARLMADKFDKLGVRTNDIDEVFSLVKKDNPEVLEIGCGNGRDAEYILKFSKSYLGIDYSSKFIELCKEKVPNGNFIINDVEEYIFPNNLDIVFAFASLLHTPKEKLKEIFHKIFTSLNAGGIFRVSLKEADEYEEKNIEEVFGKRTFYFYSKKDILEINKDFKVIRLESNELNRQRWLEVILQKA